MFEKQEAMCEYALDYSISRGVDCAECAIQFSYLNEISVSKNQIVQYKTCDRTEALLRVIKDNRAGVALLSTLSKSEIANTVDLCLETIEYMDTDITEEISQHEDRKVFIDGNKEIKMQQVATLAKEFLLDINSLYPDIVISEMCVPYSDTHVYYGNTNGVKLFHCFSKCDAFVEYNNKSSSNSTMCYLDYSFSNVPKRLLDIGDQNFFFNLKQHVTQPISLNPKNNYKVILTPSVVEDIVVGGIYSLCNSLSVLSGTTPWINKLNCCVADERLTLSLNPYHCDIVCGERITDDGTVSKPFYVLQNGILRAFLLSRKAAIKTKLPIAPNTSDCFVIDPGVESYRDIIASAKHGIVVGRYSGSDFSPAGDFSGLAKNSYMIENGMIMHEAINVKIVGNILDLLLGVGEISSIECPNGYNVLPWMVIDSGISVC